MTKKGKIDYKKELNAEQLKVVLEGDGRCLVLSGPGSGKTRTLVYRTSYLLEKGIRPEEILLVTFTRRAAREMVERIEKILPFSPKGIYAGTFHHIGNRILNQYAELLGYKRGFSILDKKDSEDLISISVQELGYKNDKEKKFPQPEVIHKILSLANNSAMPLVEVVEERFSQILKNQEEEIISFLRKVNNEYQRRKKQQNSMDYDDLLTNWLKLLEDFPEIKEKISKSFKYILVDEYQDVNVVQDRIIERMSSANGNVLVVGDDAQSIYSFRAAEIKNILNFSKKSKKTKVFKLETNYRSIPEILDVANQIISFNKNKLDKTLKSVKKNGKAPMVIPVRNGREQARFIADRISSLKQEGVPFSEMAVLFRARHHSAELELELARGNVPYLVRGGVRFFEQVHVKDIISILKILVNFQDELSWERALRCQEGIGMVYSRKIFQRFVKGNGIESLTGMKRKDLLAKASMPKAAFGLRRLINLLEGSYKIFLNKKEGYISEMIIYILDNWYEEHLRNNFPNADDRIEDTRQLALLSAGYNNLEEMINSFSLSEDFARGGLRENQGYGDLLTLSTVHQAKGLEWKAVFIISLNNGHFPHSKSFDQEGSLEEERRLFYVAVTRCKEDLCLIYPLFFSRGRMEVPAQPSIFLEEMGQEFLESWEIQENDEEEEWI